MYWILLHAQQNLEYEIRNGVLKLCWRNATVPAKPSTWNLLKRRLNGIAIIQHMLYDVHPSYKHTRQ